MTWKSLLRCRSAGRTNSSVERRHKPKFGQNWQTVTQWKVDSRYRDWSAAEAGDMVGAVTARGTGVLACDKATLVASEVASLRAVSAIERAGLPIFAAIAIWSQFPASGRIVIASPDVEKFGPAKVIAFLDGVLATAIIVQLSDVYIVITRIRFARQVARLFRTGQDFLSLRMVPTIQSEELRSLATTRRKTASFSSKCPSAAAPRPCRPLSESALSWARAA